MDVRNPTRLTTLGPIDIQIIEHIGNETSISNLKLFPFNTIFQLKQRISLLHKNDKIWLPYLLYLAVEAEDGYSSIEYKWPFRVGSPDEAIGIPDNRIYGDDGRLPIFPKVLTNATVQQVLTSNTIHVWSFQDIAKKAGFRENSLPNDTVFQGFLQLYWPSINTTEQLLEGLRPLTEKDTAIFKTTEEFLAYIDERSEKVESLLLTNSLPTELRELRRYRSMLPKVEEYRNGELELLFYKLQPSESLPFLRFFPISERIVPLVKLHTNNTGRPMLEQETLDLLLADNPTPTDSSILLLKAPIKHPRAPKGTSWTLAIFEDGSCELSIGAPRKDSPLIRVIVDSAWDQLKDFLAQTPFKSHTEQTLLELNAVYECVSTLTTKQSKSELRAKLDTLAPFFNEESLQSSSTAAVSLRFKAVSNFSGDVNPIENFITVLFLKDSAASMESIPIASYVGVLVKEFGISIDMAGTAIQTWLNKNAEFVSTDKSILATRNLGTIVNVYNMHPKYLFQLGNIESYIDLQRILSLLSMYVNTKLEDIRIGKVKELPPPPLPAPIVPLDNEIIEDSAMDDLMALEMQMMGIGQDEIETETLQDNLPQEVPLIQEPVAVPLPLAEGETIPPIGDEWFLQRLKNRDVELFAYKTTGNPHVKQYSRACAKTADRQPHVMAPETYQRARTLYGDDVFWVELPLEKDNLLAAMTVAKAPAEREKDPRKSLAELLELEKRALRLGFPLKQDKSIISLPKYSSKVSDADKAEINMLLEIQRKKPLWLVYRLGSSPAKTNYYICGEFWCVRDDLPIIPEEFRGTKYRDGRTKSVNSCPFCGGTLIQTLSRPGVGETVLKRTHEPPAIYAGIQDVYHPDGFALPCCFVSPKDLALPEGAQEPPPPKVPLPPLQAPIEERREIDTQPPEPAHVPMVVVDRESRDRPFTAKIGSAKNKWYLANQNVLGRSTEEWFSLGQGEIAVPPKSVNKLLGQDPEKFLTAVKGIFAVSQNSYLLPTGAGFVRYGLSSNNKPGESFLSLLAYANYVSRYLQTEDDNLIISTPAEILNDILGKKEPLLRKAFPQANYGTLLHEFSTPGIPLGPERDLEFQAWWGASGRATIPSQRAYAINHFLAYDNFKNYLRSLDTPKELRHFETLFATPGLFSDTGFIVVRIVYPKNKVNPPRIICPTFGVSLNDQLQKPPLLFVLEDEVSGTYDPLVFFEGKGKDTFLFFGVIQIEKPSFQSLSPMIREAIAGFVTQFYGPTEGCGRSVSPIHPWLPMRDSEKVPKLSTILNTVTRETSDITGIPAQLRDRSNRLIGCIFVFDKKEFFLPVLDDGIINFKQDILWGEEIVPRPPLQNILEMLTGLQIVVREKKLGKLFPAYLPKKLIARDENYVAVELTCGVWIPFEPFSLTSDIRHRRFADLKQKVVRVSFADAMPWDLDVSLLRPSKPEDPTVGVTSEEFLNEAYQHLRISFSKWLNTVDGNRVRKQIELLRRARQRLPLFELQKRLDILLTSIIANPTNPWMTVENGAPSSIALLRRDCLAIRDDPSKCVGGCSWSEGRCLIHTSVSERYVDPIRVCIARLTDELLRTFGAAEEILKQRVPYLRSLDRSSIQKTENGILFGISGKGNETLYTRLGYGDREPTEFTRGLTYPEEVDIIPEDEFLPGFLSADWATILQKAQFGAPIQRNLRSRLVASLYSCTGVPLESIEERLGEQFTGKESQWLELSQAFRFNTVLTKLDNLTKVLVPSKILQATVSVAGSIVDYDFVVLDDEGIPLQLKSTKKQRIRLPELPTTLRLWLEV